MRRIAFSVILLCCVSEAAAQTDWRIGLEYNEIGDWSQPHHDTLLERLQSVMGRHSAINVNGLGSWSAMQRTSTSAIDFHTSDSVVVLFQRRDFELTWYLRCDATWAFPSKSIPLFTTAAPDPRFESAWKNYVRAVVERYDGDGIDDMPGSRFPIRFCIQIGEIKFGISGKGDEETGPFWVDSIDALLRLHRLSYEAVHEADPSGQSRIVSSGALLLDLYSDFPDYPAFDPPDSNSTIGKRLRGFNNRGARFTAGFDSLKKMLRSFGDDTDGIECDYIGWHPHFSWRGTDQEFHMIQSLANSRPVYVDDMWCNIFAVGYAAGLNIPGIAVFNAPKFLPPSADWVRRLYGDFPNPLFTGLDPHAMLFAKRNTGDLTALDWYSANGARHLVKSMATAFGEGAERASFSGTNDLLRGVQIGWLNLLGLRSEGYAMKPQAWTMKLLVEKISDFTSVRRLPPGQDPRTRVYRFERPRGPIDIAWSETGGAPDNLDYRSMNGETVKIGSKSAWVLQTFPVTERNTTMPDTAWISVSDNEFVVRWDTNLYFSSIGMPRMQCRRLLPRHSGR